MLLKLGSYFSFVFSIVVFMSCKQELKPVKSDIDIDDSALVIDMAKGFQLLSSNCFACHSPNPDINPRVAPSMAEIKLQYLEKNKEESLFIEQIKGFMIAPNADKALMKSAIDQYGLMPKMDFPDTDLQNIAAYIYRTDIESNNWYSEEFLKEMAKYKSSADSLTIKERGSKYAMATKGILGKNLLAAIKERGTSGAIDFCNTKAIQLTDSMSLELGVKIKRVSDLNRNAGNKASQLELDYIQKSKEKLAAGEKIEPEVIEASEQYTAYYPIMTNNLCLQCHGIPNQDIKPEVIESLHNLYPDDLAVGFKEGDLRGIWVIEMEK